MLGARSVEEWAEFRGVMPHLTTFTACWSVLRHHSALHCVVYRWERLRHFVTRDSCPWAYCYKLQDTGSDHHCVQVGVSAVRSKEKLSVRFGTTETRTRAADMSRLREVSTLTTTRCF